jgi:hypothetical protein
MSASPDSFGDEFVRWNHNTHNTHINRLARFGLALGERFLQAAWPKLLLKKDIRRSFKAKCEKEVWRHKELRNLMAFTTHCTTHVPHHLDILPAETLTQNSIQQKPRLVQVCLCVI